MDKKSDKPTPEETEKKNDMKQAKESPKVSNRDKSFPHPVSEKSFDYLHRLENTIGNYIFSYLSQYVMCGLCVCV